MTPDLSPILAIFASWPDGLVSAVGFGVLLGLGAFIFLPGTSASIAKHYRFFLCYLMGCDAGEAADVGLVPGVVCYRCGSRLHRCKRQAR